MASDLFMSLYTLLTPIVEEKWQVIKMKAIAPTTKSVLLQEITRAALVLFTRRETCSQDTIASQ